MLILINITKVVYIKLWNYSLDVNSGMGFAITSFTTNGTPINVTRPNNIVPSSNSGVNFGKESLRYE